MLRRMRRDRVLLSWSSGKDSAWALRALRREGRLEVVGLLTTVVEERERVAMHGVRRELLAAQAKALDLPLRRVPLPAVCPDEAYQERMARALDAARREGLEGVAFGDLFLEDVRAYRERQVEALGLEAHFPLWGSDTDALAREMIAAGLRATITCVDPAVFAPQALGLPFDSDFLAALPAGVDPCGENGEFHTFVHAGPGFHQDVPAVPGKRVQREGFLFVDLVPPAPPSGR